MQAIDRNSAEPYYQQLARILETSIKAGEYKPGERFPGETELCRSYDLARSTVRETLRTLEQNRLIRMVPRRGAFVADISDSHWKLQVTQGFLEPEAHSPDRTIRTTVIRSGFEPLPPQATEALGLADREEGFVLERVRYMDAKPAMYSTNYLPADIGAALVGKPVLQGTASLNQTLREAGYSVFAARREVAAVAATAPVAKHLQLGKDAPILLIESISRTETGRAFDFYQSFVRSDVVTISVDAEARTPSQNE
ncbi:MULTISPECIES: GntR family transcriptional regulator [unclassified Sinorhizobium]|uniref:GntR family transcriptional regulator n=1 Tax=unclassified Sinorhizobium TaxID=2613772 RepID=UPI0035236959